MICPVFNPYGISFRERTTVGVKTKWGPLAKWGLDMILKRIHISGCKMRSELILTKDMWQLLPSVATKDITLDAG